MLEVRECWGEGVLEVRGCWGEGVLEVCLISISITDHNSPSYCLPTCAGSSWTALRVLRETVSAGRW